MENKTHAHSFRTTLFISEDLLLPTKPTSHRFFSFQCRYWKRARNAECESERFNLYQHWARFLIFYKEQPLNLIR